MSEREEFHEEIVTNITSSPFGDIISSGDFIPSPRNASTPSPDIISTSPCEGLVSATSMRTNKPSTSWENEDATLSFSVSAAGPSTESAKHRSSSMPPPTKKRKTNQTSSVQDGLAAALNSVSSVLDNRRNSQAHRWVDKLGETGNEGLGFCISLMEFFNNSTIEYNHRRRFMRKCMFEFCKYLEDNDL